MSTSEDLISVTGTLNTPPSSRTRIRSLHCSLLLPPHNDHCCCLFSLISGDSASCAFQVRILDTLADISDFKKARNQSHSSTLTPTTLCAGEPRSPPTSVGDQYVVKIESLDDKNKLDSSRIGLFKLFPGTPTKHTSLSSDQEVRP